MTGDRMIDVVAPAATPRNAKCACGSGSRSLYGSILHAVPGLPDAEHMIGVVGLCEGDYVRALSTLRRVAGRRAAWASRP